MVSVFTLVQHIHMSSIVCNVFFYFLNLISSTHYTYVRFDLNQRHEPIKRKMGGGVAVGQLHCVIDSVNTTEILTEPLTWYNNLEIRTILCHTAQK